MKAKLNDLWRYSQAQNHFFHEAGYFRERRKHAEICICCWLAYSCDLDGASLKSLTFSRQHHYRRILKIRNAKCPCSQKKLIIPWGRNRKYPPEGCKCLLEHAVIDGDELWSTRQD